jgi:hypothetical protein
MQINLNDNKGNKKIVKKYVSTSPNYSSSSYNL